MKACHSAAYPIAKARGLRGEFSVNKLPRKNLGSFGAKEPIHKYKPAKYRCGHAHITILPLSAVQRYLCDVLLLG